MHLTHTSKLLTIHGRSLDNRVAIERDLYVVDN